MAKKRTAQEAYEYVYNLSVAAGVDSGITDKATKDTKVTSPSPTYAPPAGYTPPQPTPEYSAPTHADAGYFAPGTAPVSTPKGRQAAQAELAAAYQQAADAAREKQNVQTRNGENYYAPNYAENIGVQVGDTDYAQAVANMYAGQAKAMGAPVAAENMQARADMLNKMLLYDDERRRQEEAKKAAIESDPYAEERLREYDENFNPYSKKSILPRWDLAQYDMAPWAAERYGMQSGKAPQANEPGISFNPYGESSFGGNYYMPGAEVGAQRRTYSHAGDSLESAAVSDKARAQMEAQQAAMQAAPMGAAMQIYANNDQLNDTINQYKSTVEQAEKLMRGGMSEKEAWQQAGGTALGGNYRQAKNYVESLEDMQPELTPRLNAREAAQTKAEMEAAFTAQYAQDGEFGGNYYMPGAQLGLRESVEDIRKTEHSVKNSQNGTVHSWKSDEKRQGDRVLAAQQMLNEWNRYKLSAERASGQVTDKEKWNELLEKFEQYSMPRALDDLKKLAKAEGASGISEKHFGFGKDDARKLWLDMSDTEKATYEYYALRSDDDARKYIEAVRMEHNRVDAEAEITAARQKAIGRNRQGWAQGFSNWAGASLAETAQNLSPENVLKIAGQAIQNAATGNYDTLDLNDESFRANELAQVAAEEFLKGRNGVEGLASELAMQLFQQVGTTASLAINPAVGAYYIASTSAGTTAYNALKENSRPGEALALALGAAAAEYVTEKMPFDQMFGGGSMADMLTAKNARQQMAAIGRGLFGQAATEAGEEVASEMINSMLDIAVRGKNSAQGKQYQALVDAGYSESSALLAVMGEYIKGDLAKTALLSALTGGLMGMGNTARMAFNAAPVRQIAFDDTLTQRQKINRLADLQEQYQQQALHPDTPAAQQSAQQYADAIGMLIKDMQTDAKGYGNDAEADAALEDAFEAAADAQAVNDWMQEVQALAEEAAANAADAQVRAEAAQAQLDMREDLTDEQREVLGEVARAEAETPAVVPPELLARAKKAQEQKAKGRKLTGAQAQAIEEYERYKAQATATIPDADFGGKESRMINLMGLNIIAHDSATPAQKGAIERRTQAARELLYTARQLQAAGTREANAQAKMLSGAAKQILEEARSLPGAADANSYMSENAKYNEVVRRLEGMVSGAESNRAKAEFFADMAMAAREQGMTVEEKAATDLANRYAGVKPEREKSGKFRYTGDTNVNTGESQPRIDFPDNRVGKKSGLVQDTYAKQLTHSEAEKLDSLGSLLGVEIRVSDKMGNVDGMYADGTIWLNLKGSEPVSTVLTHEVVHRMKESSPDMYGKMEEFVEQNVSLQRRMLIAEGLSEAGYSEEQLREEGVARAFGYMLGDTDVLNGFAKDHRSIARKLLDYFSDIAKRIKNRQTKEQSRNAALGQRVYSELFHKVNEMEGLLSGAIEHADASVSGNTGEAKFFSSSEATRKIDKLQTRSEHLASRAKKSTKASADLASTTEVAQQLKKSIDSSADEKTVAEAVQNLRNMALTGKDSDGRAVTVDSMLRYAERNIADVLLADINPRTDARRMLDRIYRAFKGKTVSIPSEIREKVGIEKIKGLPIDTYGMPISEAYAKLSEISGDIFPAEFTDTLDQAEAIVVGFEYLQDNKKISEDQMYDLRQELTQMVMDDAFNIRLDTEASAARAAQREVLEYESEKGDARVDQMMRKAWKASQEVLKYERQKNEKIIRATVKTGQQLIKYEANKREVLERKLERAADSQLRSELLKHANDLNKLAKKGTRAEKAEIRNLIDGLLLTSKSLTPNAEASIEALKYAYEASVTDKDIAFVKNPDIEQRIQALSETAVNDMDIDDARDLLAVIKATAHKIRTERKVKIQGEQMDLAKATERSIESIRASRGIKGDGKWITKQDDAGNFFRRLTAHDENSPLYKAYQDVANGHIRRDNYKRGAMQMFDSFVNNADYMRKVSGKHADVLEVRSANKGSVKMTRGMLMELYMHSMNADSVKHFTEGGVTIPNLERLAKGDRDAYTADALEQVQFTPEMIREEARKKLSQTDFAFMRAVERYFEHYSKPRLNDVSEAVFGYAAFEVPHYYPIKTDKNYTRKDFTEAAKMNPDGSMYDPGFTKSRVKASNPIMLGNINETLARSLEQHAQYVGFSEAVHNMNKLLQGQIWADSTDAYGREIKKQTDTMSKAISDKTRTAGMEHIETFMRVVQNAQEKSKSPTDEWINKLIGNQRGAVTRLNLGMAAKQITGSIGSVSQLGWDAYLAGAVPHMVGKKNDKIINIYSPLLWSRGQGYLSNEAQNTKGGGSDWPKAFDWMSAMDVQTTRQVWAMAEYRVKRDFPTLEKGTESEIAAGESPFYKKVAEVFNETMNRTQPTYEAAFRPQTFFSNSLADKMLNAFKSQAYLNGNLLIDAVGEVKDAQRSGKIERKRKAVKKLANTLTSQAVMSVAESAIGLVWQALRGNDDEFKDEEGNIAWGKVLSRVAVDFALNLAGSFHGIPGALIAHGIPEVADMLLGQANEKGWIDTDFRIDQNDLDMDIGESFANTIESAKAAVSLATDLSALLLGQEDEEKPDWYKMGKQGSKILQQAGELINFPVANLLNITKAVGNVFLKGKGGDFVGDYMADAFINGKENAKWEDMMIAAREAGNTEAYNELGALLVKNGVAEDIKALEESLSAYETKAAHAETKESPEYKAMQTKVQTMAADIKAAYGKDVAEALTETMWTIGTGDEKRDLTVAEMETIYTERLKQAENLLSGMAKAKGYDQLDEEAKDALAKKLTAYSKALGNEKITGKLSDEYTAVKKFVDGGKGTAAEYFIGSGIVSDATDEAGKTTQAVKSEGLLNSGIYTPAEAAQFMYDRGMIDYSEGATAAEKRQEQKELAEALAYLKGKPLEEFEAYFAIGGEDRAATRAAKRADAKALGMSLVELQEFTEKLEKTQGTKANGEVLKHTREAEDAAVINRSGWTNAQKWTAYQSTVKKSETIEALVKGGIPFATYTAALEYVAEFNTTKLNTEAKQKAYDAKSIKREDVRTYLAHQVGKNTKQYYLLLNALSGLSKDEKAALDRIL